VKHLSIRNLRMDDALIEAMIHNRPMSWLQDRLRLPACTSQGPAPARGIRPRARRR
jgi:hypothetical protein